MRISSIRARLFVTGVLVGCALTLVPMAAAALADRDDRASNGSRSTTTVTGSVSPNGAATSWHFSTERRPRTAHPRLTECGVGDGVGCGVGEPRAQARYDYHYRLVDTNSGGTGRGADAILTTSSAPVAVTGSASSVTATTQRFNGTVNPEGRDDWYAGTGRARATGRRQRPGAGAGTNARASPRR